MKEAFNLLMSGLDEAIMMKDTLKKFREYKFTDKVDGEWHSLKHILSQLPNNRYEKIRKLKLKARYWYIDKLISTNIRIGKRLDNTFINIVPLDDPYNYKTINTARVDLYIPHDIYRTKILPLMLAYEEDKKP